MALNSCKMYGIKIAIFFQKISKIAQHHIPIAFDGCELPSQTPVSDTFELH